MVEEETEGGWEPDVQMTKGGMARFLALDYIVAVTVVGILACLIDDSMEMYVLAALTIIPLMFLLYWAFLSDYREQSRFRRRAFDLPFDELSDITMDILGKDGRRFASGVFLGEGVPAAGAGRLTRWNYSRAPHFMDFTVEGLDVRLRIYKPRYRRMSTCSIVLGPFDGEELEYVERLRQELDWKLDAYGVV